jgi:hypothetical protein
LEPLSQLHSLVDAGSTIGRRKTSPAEDVMELIALMPSWVGVSSAGVSFIFCVQALERLLVSP